MTEPTLFDVTEINGMRLSNRFVRAPTWEGMADEDGHITGPLLSLYEELALGGVGLIITGYAAVYTGEYASPRMMGIYEDSFISEYRILTETIHQYESKIALQIAYGGSQTYNHPENRLIWGPSAIAHPHTGVEPAPIETGEIRHLIRCYGDAAERACRAGFDAVEIHAAAGYFMSQFLSPSFNHRNDQYGGSLENRARILFETVQEVRDRVGRRYPILVKINCADFIPDGLSFPECRWICRMLAADGADAIEVSGGLVYDTSLNPARYHIHAPEDEAYFASYAAKLAEEVDIPVILDGGLRSLEVMERLLATTTIAYFALSRPLIAEPGLIARWKAGDRMKARCISCGRCICEEGYIECVLKEGRSSDVSIPANRSGD
jgi:2,4-dienoyl-CoA reductase-like NADH-dependent reductase (Old Yellow Enzyme family)